MRAFEQMGMGEKVVSGCLFVVSGPSGSGKTSLVRALVRGMNDMVVSISYTTRPMRPGETDGVDYHFVDQKSFEKLIAEDALLEHARVFDHYYGTGRPRVQEHLDSGFDVLLPIDWQGYQRIQAQDQPCIGVFILPPSRQVLKSRLSNRAQDGPEIIARRMAEAQSEMTHYTEYPYLIINDDFATSLNDLQTIVRAERLRSIRQREKYQDLLAGLLA